MTEAIEKLTFKDKQVRTIKRGSELLWCGIDCCRAMELGNAPETMRRLEADEKLTIKISDGQRPTRAIFVTEPGLYKLIMRSNKPVAREFQRWVCHEVLPSIRRTGCYSVGGGLSGREEVLVGAVRTVARGMLSGARQKVMDCMKELLVGNPPFGRMTADDFRELVEWCIRRMETQAFDPSDNKCPPWAMKAAESSMERQIAQSLAGRAPVIEVEVSVRDANRAGH